MTSFLKKIQKRLSPSTTDYYQQIERFLLTPFAKDVAKGFFFVILHIAIVHRAHYMLDK
jgi:hypothetical protein